jgi:hypothetical protein
MQSFPAAVCDSNAKISCRPHLASIHMPALPKPLTMHLELFRAAS